jgi:hypothetical protein
MKKGIIIGLVIISLTAILVIVVRMQNMYDAPYRKIEFNTTDFVSNRTTMGYMDTLVQAGLISLGVDSVSVLIRPMVQTSVQDKNGTLELFAYIKGNRNQFSLYVLELNRRDAIEVIAHELIHLDQYRTGRLSSHGDSAEWLGLKMRVNDIPYEEREWEVEARRESPALAVKMKRMLVE